MLQPPQIFGDMRKFPVEFDDSEQNSRSKATTEDPKKSSGSSEARPDSNFKKAKHKNQNELQDARGVVLAENLTHPQQRPWHIG